jgi:hypothetical protein
MVWASLKEATQQSPSELDAKGRRDETFTAQEWRRFDQLVARQLGKIRRASLNRRVNLNTGRLTAFEDRLPLAMKRILEYTVSRSDDRPDLGGGWMPIAVWSGRSPQGFLIAIGRIMLPQPLWHKPAESRSREGSIRSSCTWPWRKITSRCSLPGPP